jgi:hypothetical protein
MLIKNRKNNTHYLFIGDTVFNLTETFCANVILYQIQISNAHTCRVLIIHYCHSDMHRKYRISFEIFDTLSSSVYVLVDRHNIVV